MSTQKETHIRVMAERKRNKAMAAANAKIEQIKMELEARLLKIDMEEIAQIDRLSDVAIAKMTQAIMEG